MWVHKNLRKRRHCGEYHHLVQELRLNNGRFMVYFRMSLGQFDILLSIIGPSITKMTTNYRESIGPAVRLSIFAAGNVAFKDVTLDKSN